MAKVTGVIRGGDEALQLVLVQLDKGDRAWPARQRTFAQACLATGYTDATGNYELDYPDLPEHEQQHGGGHVVLQAFSNGRLRWQSPINPWGPDIVIGGEVVLPTPPLPPRNFSVDGQITTCARPASGYHVSLFEVTQTGFATGSSACLLGPRNVRLAGTSIVDAGGEYHIPYVASKAAPNACAFLSSVFVEVGQLPDLADWTSEEIDRRFSITFDHDFIDDCELNSTVIRVVNQFGQSVAGAQVTTAGADLGVTSSAGLLAVTGLADGQQIAARKLLVENETTRAHHSQDSSRDWNFRCYTTSVSVDHDADGNNVMFGIDTVDSSVPIQELVQLPTNALVSFNLLVSVEWDASQSELINYRDRFLDTSELLYNATDGQFCIERVSVVDNARHWDSADIRVHASINQKSYATLNGGAGSGGRVTMNPIDTFFPGTLMHELGHYLFGVRDEYKEASGWDPANGSARCTLASTSTNAAFTDGGDKDSCLMRGARFETMKKFCSGHSANPHVDGTKQGSVDCWTDILGRFNATGVGLPNATFWRPRGPVNRRAIVGRLPDSGLPIGTATSAAAGTPLSFIPLASWKPRWHISSVETVEECPTLVVKTLEDGVPVGDVFVQLRTTDGHNTLQGRTRTSAGQLGDGSFLDVGELSIRGAHLGDEIRAFRISGGNPPNEGTATVVDCAVVLEVTIVALGWQWVMNAGFDQSRNLVVSTDDGPASPMIRVAVDGMEEPATVHLAQNGTMLEGTVGRGHGDQQLSVDTLFVDASGDFFSSSESFSICEISPWMECSVRSPDGQAELDLPVGASSETGRVAIREASASGPARPGWRVAAGPFHLFASFDRALLQPALLHFQPGDQRIEPTDHQFFSIVKLDPSGMEWEEIEQSSYNPEPLVVTTRISELGTYALFERRENAG